MMIMIMMCYFLRILLLVQVIILEITSRAMKAKIKPKDYLFADNLHWILSPAATGKLHIAPIEEGIGAVGDDHGDDIDDDRSEVFHSVKSHFSRCSSENELDYLSHQREQSVWGNLAHCEGWPFGLIKRMVILPPLPSSPSDSWTWHKKNIGNRA